MGGAQGSTADHDQPRRERRCGRPRVVRWLAGAQGAASSRPSRTALL